jgi:FixJ family two-component response regulator
MGCACPLDVYWPLGQLDSERVTFDICGMPRTLHNVAIIDDDAAVLKALARLLRTRAFAVVTFQSGQQFLASLPEPLPDCLILDLQMPGMTGLEIQQDLARKGIRIPTIIVTAHDEAGIRERCKSAGAIAYLAKPVPQAALFAAIEAAGSDGAC